MNLVAVYLEGHAVQPNTFSQCGPQIWPMGRIGRWERFQGTDNDFLGIVFMRKKYMFSSPRNEIWPPIWNSPHKRRVPYTRRVLNSDETKQVLVALWSQAMPCKKGSILLREKRKKVLHSFLILFSFKYDMFLSSNWQCISFINHSRSYNIYRMGTLAKQLCLNTDIFMR